MIALNDTLLIVMNPRSIPECIDAFRELRGVDKAWCSYMTELELVPVIANLVASTDYARYSILSDDTTPTQGALDEVLRLHDAYPDAVACGWVNIDAVSERCTINPEPLRFPELPSSDASYSFITLDEAAALPEGPVRTYFHGMCFATMSRDHWLRFPYDVERQGNASDRHQCLRLQDAGVPIWTSKRAGFHHVKELQNRKDRAPEKHLLNGVRVPRVTIEREMSW